MGIFCLALLQISFAGFKKTLRVNHGAEGYFIAISPGNIDLGELVVLGGAYLAAQERNHNQGHPETFCHGIENIFL